MALPWSKLGNKTFTFAKSLGRWVKKPRGAEARVDSDTQVIQVVQARGCWRWWGGEKWPDPGCSVDAELT